MNKDEIFDYIIEEEDKLLKLIRFQLKQKVYEVYGNDGVKVLEKYYRQLDGEEDYDEIETDDCNDCKEKAKKLIETSNFLKEIGDVLFSDKLDILIKDFDLSSFNCNLNECIKSIRDKSCFEIDSETVRNLSCRILIEKAKKQLEKK